MRGWMLGVFLLMAGSVQAENTLAPKVLREDLQQGGFYVAEVQPGVRVQLGGKEIPLRKDGLLVIGFDRHQPERNMLEVCKGEACEQVTLWVKAREYQLQKVTKIPPKTVTPDAKELKRVEADAKATGAARASAAKAFEQTWTDLGKGFVLPVTAVTSGVYGSARTYNGEERSWHKGHDLAAPTGTPVKAPAAGVVRLARDTFMSGNLIMLDHGGGITTVYAHLSKMAVKVGDEVKAGEVIGKVGTTGRSSGPHLHWGMYWREIAIDPILWVDKGVLKQCAERKTC